jgi:hypothetical protein
LGVSEAESLHIGLSSAWRRRREKGWKGKGREEEKFRGGRRKEGRAEMILEMDV